MRFGSRSGEPELRGGRVWLRLPRMDDFPAWRTLRQASAGFIVPWEPRWHGNHLWRSAFRTRVRWARRAAREGTALAFLVFRSADAALLGGITVENMRGWPSDSATLGYWIGESHARQGYMTEALRLVVEHVFRATTITRLEAACVPENVASRALLLRCGFVPEGRARAWLEIAGRWRDHDRYVRLHPERRDPERTA